MTVGSFLHGLCFVRFARWAWRTNNFYFVWLQRQKPNRRVAVDTNDETVRRLCSHHIRRDVNEIMRQGVLEVSKLNGEGEC